MKKICYTVNDSKSLFYGCDKEKRSPNNECFESQNSIQFNYYGVGPEFFCMVISGLLLFIVLCVIEG
jgi:hypothetical protein